MKIVHIPVPRILLLLILAAIIAVIVEEIPPIKRELKILRM